jgi:uncharacterized membrane protein
MLGITPFGLVHTAISLASLAIGLSFLFRRRDIRWQTGIGKAFVLGTAASALTGLFIFRHGGFNEAHALSLVTLITLAAAVLIELRSAPGSGWNHVSTMLYSLTVFFHFIPGFNETLVRLPVDAPYISGPDDPKLVVLLGITFAVFLVIAALQWRRLRRQRNGLRVAQA